MQGIIYKVINKKTGKIYIGQTSYSLHRRRQLHLYEKQGYKSYFRNSLRKHPNFFIWTIKATIKAKNKKLLKQELNRLEKFYIKYFKSKFPYGYNLTDGGDGCLGIKMSKKNRLLNSARMKINNPILIPKNRQIAINNISSKEAKKKHIEYRRSPEARKLRSENMLGDKNPMRRFPEKNWMNDPIKKAEVRRKQHAKLL